MQIQIKMVCEWVMKLVFPWYGVDKKESQCYISF
jgi:hypothetical protein